MPVDADVSGRPEIACRRLQVLLQRKRPRIVGLDHASPRLKERGGHLARAEEIAEARQARAEAGQRDAPVVPGRELHALRRRCLDQRDARQVVAEVVGVRLPVRLGRDDRALVLLDLRRGVQDRCNVVQREVAAEARDSDVELEQHHAVRREVTDSAPHLPVHGGLGPAIRADQALVRNRHEADALDARRREGPPHLSGHFADGRRHGVGRDIPVVGVQPDHQQRPFRRESAGEVRGHPGGLGDDLERQVPAVVLGPRRVHVGRRERAGVEHLADNAAIALEVEPPVRLPRPVHRGGGEDGPAAHAAGEIRQPHGVRPQRNREAHARPPASAPQKACSRSGFHPSGTGSG